MSQSVEYSIVKIGDRFIRHYMCSMSLLLYADVDINKLFTDPVAAD